MSDEKLFEEVREWNSKIANIDLTDDTLKITFENGKTLKMVDQGQSCCEHRYLTCDDNFYDFFGDYFVSVDQKRVEHAEDAEVHEIHFLDVQTSKGVFSLCAHVEHNGYYGGICMRYYCD